MKIYVASSWRNSYQEYVVARLKKEGHEVYDFKNPGEGKRGFAWSEIDENWKDWNNEQYMKALNHPISNQGFSNDFSAMQWADACVLVMPCGRSAHVEAGWMQGMGKPTIILLNDNIPAEPDLMYKMFELVANSIESVVSHLEILDDMLSENDFLPNPQLNAAIKAAKWDALRDEIADYYEGEDEKGNEVPPKKQGDIIDIGEAAAYAFGFM